jgi:hypothetical protein
MYNFFVINAPLESLYERKKIQPVHCVWYALTFNIIPSAFVMLFQRKRQPIFLQP